MYTFRVKSKHPPIKFKQATKKEFLLCTFYENFPPLTIAFNMPEPDTNDYVHLRLAFS